MEFNKSSEGTALNYRTERSYLTELTSSPDFIQALLDDASRDNSPVEELKDLEVLKALTDRICSELRTHVEELRQFSIRKVGSPDRPETRVRLIIKVMDKLLDLWERRISDFTLSSLLLDLINHAQSHAVIADVFRLIAKYMFCPNVDLIFYYIRAYMQHWNSYDNRRLGLDSLLTMVSDLTLVFQEHRLIRTLEVSRDSLLALRSEGLTVYQIAEKIYPRGEILEQNDQRHYERIFVAVVTKIRLVVCRPQELSDLVDCIIQSLHIFSAIEVNSQKDDIVMNIPDIFVFPPDYENIFLQLFQLFTLPQCSKATHINIIDVIKVILEPDLQTEDGEIHLDFATNMTYIRRIVTDVNNYLHGRPPIHLPLDTVSDKKFICGVLEILCKANPVLQDILQTSFEISEAVSFSNDFEGYAVEIATELATANSPSEAAEETLVDKFIAEISKGTSPHISIYLKSLNSYFQEEVRYGHLQRRDFISLVRRLIESQMFPALQTMIKPNQPITRKSVSCQVLNLIQNMCSQAPLMTDKLKPIIFYMIELLMNPYNYPKEIHALMIIPSFLHHICLKEGEIRDHVLTCGVLEQMMQIYTLNEFTKTLSPLGAVAGGCIGQIFVAINRFLVNIPKSREPIYKGVVKGCKIIIAEMREFQAYFDKQLSGIEVPETIRYENITYKINNIMRLIIKISSNFNLDGTNMDCSELHNLTETMFRLKYLNMHFPADNRWMGNCARLVDSNKGKLTQICEEIKELVAMTDLSKFESFPEGKNFFEIVQIARTNQNINQNIKILVNLSRLDRLLSLARSSTDQVPLFKRVNIFPLIGKLDRMRMKGVDDITNDLSELTKPLDDKQKRDNLHHILKSLSEKSSVSLFVQSTLKKLVNEAERARDFTVNKQIAECINTELAFVQALPKNNCLTSIYCIRLKMENVQLMLELPMIMYNQVEFPFSFTMFTYLYTQPVDNLFRVFIELTQVFSQEIKETNPHVQGFNELLRNEILKRILLILEYFGNIGDKDAEQEPEPEDSARTERRDAVRYTIMEIICGSISLVMNLPRVCDPSSKSLMQNILKSAVFAISHLSQLNDAELGRCSYNFEIDQVKKISKSRFPLLVKANIDEFNSWIIQNLTDLQLYDVPFARILCENPPDRKVYHLRNHLTKVYTNICTQIISLSKYLFQSFTLDLGVKHLKLEPIEYQSLNVRNQLAQLKVLLTTYVEVLVLLIRKQWYGSGELSISSSNISEIIKFVDQIMNSTEQMSKDESQPLLEIDGLIKNVLILVEKYLTYEIGKDKHYCDQLAEEEVVQTKKKKTNKKARHRSIVEVSGGKKSKRRTVTAQNPQKQELEQIIAEKVPKKKRRRVSKRPSSLAISLSNLLITILSKPEPILTPRTLEHLLIFLSQNARKSSRRLLKLKLEEILPLILKVKLNDPSRTGLVDRLSALGLKLFSHTQIRTDIDASIKRLLFQIQMENKDEWKPLNTIFKDLVEILFESFFKNQVLSVFRKLCEFRKDDRIVNLTNKQILDFSQTDVQKHSFRRKQGNQLYTFKKKENQKQKKGPPQFQDVRFVDYVPDKHLQALILAIIDQMIHNTIEMIQTSTTSHKAGSRSAFDFNMLSRVLQVLVRESGILIPYIIKIKCGKQINQALSKCSDETKRIVGQLLKEKKSIEATNQIRFMEMLIRLISSVSFGMVDRLIFQLCLDSYVLYKSKKGSIYPVSLPNRTGVVTNICSQESGGIMMQNFTQLGLVINLLDLREFTRICLDQNMLSLLHRLFTHTQNTQTPEFFQKANPFILNPCTILHQLNLQFNTTKHPKTIAKGKPTLDQVKQQLIGKNSLPNSKFLTNWRYFSSVHQATGKGEFARVIHRDIHDDDDSDQDGDQDGEEMSQNTDEQGSQNQDELHDEDIEDMDSSQLQGWTQDIILSQQENGEDDQGMDDQQDNHLEDERQLMNLPDDLDDQDGSLTDMFVENFFGDMNVDTDSEETVSNPNNSFFKEISGSQRLFNNQIRKMVSQVQTLIDQFMDDTPDQKNPLVQRLKSEERYNLVRFINKELKVAQLNTEHTQPSSEIKSIDITFGEQRFIYDDVAMYFTQRFRRRVDVIQRPRLITAGLGQTGQGVPLDINLPIRVQQREGEEEQAGEEQQRERQENQLQEGEEIELDQGDEGGQIGEHILRRFIDQEDDLQTFLQRQGMTRQEFRLLPSDLQQDIIQNMAIADLGDERIQRVLQEERPIPNGNQQIAVEPALDQQQEVPPNQQIIEEQQAKNEDVVIDRRRKLSQDYVKKMAKDPREILLKEKRESKLYACQDDFIVSILSMLYQDQAAHNNFPFELVRALCANPINQTKFLSIFMILLKHPKLNEEKLLHKESLSVFPMTIIQQKNGEVSMDYLNMGYSLISLKVLHILSHLSKSNSSAMVESHHNKVAFLPEWYWLPEKPYYVQLIELLENQLFHQNALKLFLTDTIFHIIKHHCLKHYSEHPSGDEGSEVMKLKPKQVRLLCSLLETVLIPEQISQVITLLCIANKENIITFISTHYLILDEFSTQLSKDIHEKAWDDTFARGKLKKILTIVYDMFESEYSTRLQVQKSRNKESIERAAVKTELLTSFKSLIQCKSLQQLCRDCVEYMCNHEISQVQLGIFTEILECFFIIYKITMHEEEECKLNKHKNISALGELKQGDMIPEAQDTNLFTKEFSLEVLFKDICQKGRTVVNTVLKQKLSNLKKNRKQSIFEDPMIYILAKNSSLIDYENKRNMFKIEIKSIKAKNKNYRTINLLISRQHVLDQSMNEIMSRSGDDLKGKLHIQFEDEQGEDAGGLTREWFSLLSKEMFNPHYAIFQPSSTGNTYHPSPKSSINQHHLTFFKFVGRIVGKAIHDGFILQAFFSAAFYKHILGQEITYHDLEDQDYEFYKNMVWLKENDITHLGLELTFSYEIDDFGERKVKDLLPKGSTIAVTEENKLDYIQRLCYAKMATAVEKQIQAFKQGFNELIPQRLVTLFDSKQLQLMISGLPTIDIVDLKENTELVNYEKSDNVIVWLFEVLESFDSNLRASFLQFVTGTSRLPSDGFKGLRGLNGPQKFNIHKDFDNTKLPRAHTCFNQLDLPNYLSKQALIEKLTVAVTEGKEGFGLV